MIEPTSGFAIAGWLLRAGVSLVQKKAVEAIFKPTLSKALHSAVEEWMKDLPDHAFVGSADSIFRPINQGLGVDSEPSPQRVLSKLGNYRIPSEYEWTADLMDHWRWIAQQSDEKMPFFRLRSEEAETLLQKLAELLVRVCQKNDDCFRVEALTQIQAVNTNVSDIKHDVQQLLLKQSEIGQIRQLLAQIPINDSHADIDAAANFITQFEPRIAIVELEKIQRTRWDTLTPRERFRVLANLGHASYTLGNIPDASKYFRQAKDFQPDDPEAQSLHALCLHIAGK